MRNRDARLGADARARRRRRPGRVARDRAPPARRGHARRGRARDRRLEAASSRSELGRPVRAYAYVKGSEAHFHPVHESILKQAGYEIAFTSISRAQRLRHEPVPARALQRRALPVADVRPRALGRLRPDLAEGHRRRHARAARCSTRRSAPRRVRVRVVEYDPSRRADVADLMGRVWGARPDEGELAWFYERNPVRARLGAARRGGRASGRDRRDQLRADVDRRREPRGRDAAPRRDRPRLSRPRHLRRASRRRTRSASAGSACGCCSRFRTPPRRPCSSAGSAGARCRRSASGRALRLGRGRLRGAREVERFGRAGRSRRAAATACCATPPGSTGASPRHPRAYPLLEGEGYAVAGRRGRLGVVACRRGRPARRQRGRGRRRATLLIAVAAAVAAAALPARAATCRPTGASPCSARRSIPAQRVPAAPALRARRPRLPVSRARLRHPGRRSRAPDPRRDGRQAAGARRAGRRASSCSPTAAVAGALPGQLPRAGCSAPGSRERARRAATSPALGRRALAAAARGARAHRRRSTRSSRRRSCGRGGVPLLLWFTHWKPSRTLVLAERLSTAVLSVDRRSFPLASRRSSRSGTGSTPTRSPASSARAGSGAARRRARAEPRPPRASRRSRSAAALAGVELEVFGASTHRRGAAPSGRACSGSASACAIRCPTRRCRACSRARTSSSTTCARARSTRSSTRRPRPACRCSRRTAASTTCCRPSSASRRDDPDELAAKLRRLADDGPAMRSDAALRERVVAAHSAGHWADSVLEVARAVIVLHVQKVAGISGSEAHLLQLLPDLRRSAAGTSAS